MLLLPGASIYLYILAELALVALAIALFPSLPASTFLSPSRYLSPSLSLSICKVCTSACRRRQKEKEAGRWRLCTASRCEHKSICEHSAAATCVQSRAKKQSRLSSLRPHTLVA